MKRAIVVAIVAALAIVGFAQPAQATAPRTYVQVSVWDRFKSPVWNAHVWVDKYTRTDMVYGKCRSGYRCIRIYMDSFRSDWAAVTNISGKNATIRINTRGSLVSRYGYYGRLSAMKHELGHANGITWHNERCTSIMYWRMTCPNGAYPPSVFTSGERYRLSVW